MCVTVLSERDDTDTVIRWTLLSTKTNDQNDPRRFTALLKSANTIQEINEERLSKETLQSVVTSGASCDVCEQVQQEITHRITPRSISVARTDRKEQIVLY